MAMSVEAMLSGDLPYDREYALHVGPRGAEVRDAGSLGEAPIDGRVGEVDTTVALKRAQYPLVVLVECGLIHVRRRMPEAADAQSGGRRGARSPPRPRPDRRGGRRGGCPRRSPLPAGRCRESA